MIARIKHLSTPLWLVISMMLGACQEPPMVPIQADDGIRVPPEADMNLPADLSPPGEDLSGPSDQGPSDPPPR